MTYFEKCQQRAELLTNFVVDANLTFLILKRLRMYQSSKNEILNLSPAFYGTVMRNATQSLIVEIPKMYNTDFNNNESTRSLLDSIQNNVGQLEDKSISAMQLKSISYNDLYSVDFDSISDMVAYFLDSIKKSEDKIRRITKLRNKYYAHWDRHFFNKLDRLFNSNPLSYNETEDLLVLNSNICMALYQYFNNSTFYPIIDNHDDISKTIHCVEEYERLLGNTTIINSNIPT